MAAAARTDMEQSTSSTIDDFHWTGQNNVSGEFPGDSVEENGFSPECQGRASAVYTTLLVIIVGTGVIGNTLSLVVLRYQSRPSTFNFLIIVLSCVDVTILLLLPVDRLMYRYETPSLALLVIYVYIIDKLAGVARLASVWMLMVIAFFRFMAVCVPLKVKIYCTHNNAKRCVLFLFIVDVLIHLPFYFSQRVVQLPNNNTTSLYQSQATTWGNSWGFHLYADVVYTTCFFFALPFVVLIFFSLSMVRTLYGTQREKYFSLAHLKHEASDVTKVVIAIIVAFLISYTPYMIWTVDSLIPGRREKLASGNCSLLVYRYTLDLFMYLNSSVNFFIYLVLRKNFRKSMKKLFTCNKRKHKPKNLEEVTSPNTEVTALKNNYFIESSS